MCSFKIKSPFGHEPILILWNHILTRKEFCSSFGILVSLSSVKYEVIDNADSPSVGDSEELNSKGSFFEQFWRFYQEYGC